MKATKATKKANFVLGQISRSFSYRDRCTFIKLYKTFVRPHLEYASQVWSPWTKKDRDMLENVQKRAVRMVAGLSGSYEEKLAACGLTTLEERRLRGDIIQTFKFVNNLNSVSHPFLSFVANQHSYTTRTSSELCQGLTSTPSKLNCRHNFFSKRICGPWNSLPTTVKGAKSVNEFKNAYDSLS